MRTVVFDTETQRYAQDVGGWHNVRDMGLACAVAYEPERRHFTFFRDDEGEGIVKLLQSADLVIGYNCVAFDLPLLEPHGLFDWEKLPIRDVAMEMQQRFGRRVSLNEAAGIFLGLRKNGNGGDAPKLWAEGRWHELLNYCAGDVWLTWRLSELKR